MHPEDRVSVAGERVMLETFLDVYRNTVADKASEVSEEDGRERLVSSLTTVGGLVKHLRWVETGWFHQLFGERAGTNQRAHERESEFVLEPGERLATLIGDYQSACARSREIAAAHALDDTVPHRTMGEVSLRWIYVHLIEETARHAGHLDILCEQLADRRQRRMQ